MSQEQCLQGVGLGLRRGLLDELLQEPELPLSFLEVAPENWLHLGGRFAAEFEQLAERFPIILHGLSLNLGGFAPLNTELLQSIKQFINTYQCPFYSEHLTACGDEGQLYDLMPIPFTEEAVHFVAKRIRQTQDILGQRIAVENASYYASLSDDLTESQFINAVVQEADCDLLLDVNNIYVNSINHGYDAKAFLQSMPKGRVHYMHVAGHFDEAEDLKVDTHGADVIDPVWDLLTLAYQTFGVKPTLLERDFNFPPLYELLQETDKIRQLQNQAGQQKRYA